MASLTDILTNEATKMLPQLGQEGVTVGILL